MRPYSTFSVTLTACHKSLKERDVHTCSEVPTVADVSLEMESANVSKLLDPMTTKVRIKSKEVNYILWF